jgi:DNA-binding transcriptional LysR family regulator
MNDAMLSARMPELSALEMLVTVARTGSLNSAAAELGRSQQALSARLATLESVTGVPLAVRSRRGSSLTAQGVVVAEWAGRLLDVAGELDAGLAALRQDRTARLSVAASLTVAERLLPRWLVMLRARRVGGPGSRPAQRGDADDGLDATLAAVNSTEVAQRVRSGAADIGFVEGPAAPRGVRSRVIGTDDLVVVVAPDHPWAQGRSRVDAAQLAGTSLVVREAGSGTRDALEAALRRRLGVDAALARPALELPTTAAIRTSVLAGAGPAVLSRLVVAEDIAAGRLRAVPVADLALTRSLRAIWLGSRTPPAGPVRDLIGIAAAGG